MAAVTICHDFGAQKTFPKKKKSKPLIIFHKTRTFHQERSSDHSCTRPLLTVEKSKPVLWHIRKSHLCSLQLFILNFFQWYRSLLPTQEELLEKAWQNCHSAIENWKLINPPLMLFSLHLLLSCFPCGINFEINWPHVRLERRELKF